MRNIFFVCLFCLLPASCSEELTLEQQIIGTINEMELLAEEGDRRGFMRMVAEDFQGQLGVLDKRGFQRFMIMQWNVNRRLHFQLGPIHVRPVVDEMAEAEFSGLVTGGTGFLPERGQFFQFQTRWIRDGSNWLLAAAEWTPIRMDGN